MLLSHTPQGKSTSTLQTVVQSTSQKLVAAKAKPCICCMELLHTNPEQRHAHTYTHTQKKRHHAVPRQSVNSSLQRTGQILMTGFELSVCSADISPPPHCSLSLSSFAPAPCLSLFPFLYLSRFRIPESSPHLNPLISHDLHEDARDNYCLSISSLATYRV